VLMKRDEGGAFDDLAVGLDSGAITRGKAIKLAGAALLSGLGVFAAAAPAEAGHRRCPRRNVRCRRRRRVFCCPRGDVLTLGSCRLAIIGDLCVEI
jgi:hypothetical protein